MIIDYGCDYTQYTELFPHHCNTLLSQGPWKRFSFYFPLRPEEDITGSSCCLKLSILDHCSQLWRNSSQLARLFKVKAALSPDLNTARWFAKMDLSASVHKQQEHLLALNSDTTTPPPPPPSSPHPQDLPPPYKLWPAPVTLCSTGLISTSSSIVCKLLLLTVW